MVDNQDVIVVAIDPDATKEAVLEAAIDLARGMGLSLVAVSVYSEADVNEARKARPEDQAYVDLVLRDAQAALRARIAPMAGGIEYECVTLEGDPGGVIHSLAQSLSARFLVVGMRNRSRVGKLLLGSTTQQLLLGSGIPVVTVPTS